MSAFKFREVTWFFCGKTVRELSLQDKVAWLSSTLLWGFCISIGVHNRQIAVKEGS